MARDLVRRSNVGQCLFEIAGVPEDDHGDQQFEAGGAVGLVLEPAVAQLTDLVEEERTGERIARKIASISAASCKTMAGSGLRGSIRTRRGSNELAGVVRPQQAGLDLHTA
jgi:hypothetical protein